ncbi:MAG TPA: hypothetical protein VIO14_11505 [Dehalococcoidia bacterium]
MFWLKSCPKCGGDLYAETRDASAEITCLQCGNVVTGQERLLLLRQARQRAERRRARRLAGVR